MLVLVPARGGSKRIPRKNLRELSGIPLILWTLVPFNAMGPVVSSDDDEILSLARKHNFRTIERPPELATDQASSVAVALHALEQTGEDSVLLLQPTSPFRESRVVEESVALFAEHGKPVVAMRPVHHAFCDGMPFKSALSAPTGSCYVIAREDLEKHGTFAPPGFISVADTSLAAIDIDTEDDWHHAATVAPAVVRRMTDHIMKYRGWTL